MRVAVAATLALAASVCGIANAWTKRTIYSSDSYAIGPPGADAHGNAYTVIDNKLVRVTTGTADPYASDGLNASTEFSFTTSAWGQDGTAYVSSDAAGLLAISPQGQVRQLDNSTEWSMLSIAPDGTVWGTDNSLLTFVTPDGKVTTYQGEFLVANGLAHDGTSVYFYDFVNATHNNLCRLPLPANPSSTSSMVPEPVVLYAGLKSPNTLGIANALAVGPSTNSLYGVVDDSVVDFGPNPSGDAFKLVGAPLPQYNQGLAVGSAAPGGPETVYTTGNFEVYGFSE